MKFRRERLKLTPLFSTPVSPTPPLYTTLVWSAPSTITMVSQLSATDPHLLVVTLLSPT